MSRLLHLDDGLRQQLHQEPLFAELASPGGPRLIGVSACHRDAGVTTVAAHLAHILHERTGASVALIEANVRQPAFARWFDLDVEQDFGACVRDGQSLATACVPTPLGGVSCLPARQDLQPLPWLRHAGDSLRAAKGQGIEYLVVDLPPLLDAPDALLLAPVLDAVLLVLGAEQTRWQVAQQARQRLLAAGGRLAGAVLNRKPLYIPPWLYRLL